MVRIDDPTIPNPFAWRVSEMTASGTDPLRRLQLAHDMLLSEAEEIANGHHHLTIVHGDPTDVAASRQLSGFYDTVRRLARDIGGWVRVRGDVNYLTITLRGPGAEQQIETFAAAARSADPGGWRIVASARPPLS